MPTVLFFVAVILFMYLVLWRPQQARVRRQRELVNAVNVGDYVVTVGGVVARVVDTAPDRLQLEIADGVMVEFLRQAVNRRLEPSEVAFATAGEAGDDEDSQYDGEDTGDGEAASEDEAEPAAAGEEAEPVASATEATPATPAVAGEGQAAVPADIVAESVVPTSEQDPH